MLCVAYTSVLASVHASALTKHHVRNPILSAAGGFATGAIGLYTSWAAFLSLVPTAPPRLGDIGYLGYLASPTAIAEGIRATSESGWYSIFGWEVSGSLWLGTVGVETVFIVVGSTAIALDASSKVYCEACDRWCDTETNAIDFLDAESFLEALEEIVLGNMRAVATIPVVPDSAARRGCIDIISCPTCDGTAAMSLAIIELEKDRSDTDKTVLFSKIMLDRVQRQEFMTLAKIHTEAREANDDDTTRETGPCTPETALESTAETPATHGSRRASPTALREPRGHAHRSPGSSSHSSGRA